ncbi:MAG: glycosyltransferase [Planctomycetes bacterium]|nr:glycosyltransferase [Planctomycetota bacterium]
MARILMLLPCAVDAPRGNVTTARRLAQGLARHRHEVLLHEAAELASAPGADLVVALHAGHSAPAAAALAAERGCGYLVLFTGTDLNGRPNAAARQAVQGAAACVVLGPAAAKRARQLHGGVPERYTVIRQAAVALPEPPDREMPPGCPALAAEDELILMPTGIRAVKAPRQALWALAPLAAKRPTLRLWIAGPELEAAEAEALRQELETAPWACWTGPVPRDRLLTLVRRSALVISTSRSEGGPPNALLEAALARRAILASDIPAHREFPGPEQLYQDHAQLRRLVEGLLDDPSGRGRDAAKLREAVRTGYSQAAEAMAWSRVVAAALERV